MGLTNEDKEWMMGQSEATRLNLTQGIEATRLDLTQRIEAARLDIDGLRGLIDGLRQEFDEKLEHVETRLLTEFHKWASPTELRLSSHATAMRALDLEIENVRERISKLEPPLSPQ